ncbi:MAG TPA: hypothetical protein VHB79_10320 [Polyangiaceae bacterium]|nr:hypothetical protein [Polyangiaceae bacterium]
MTGKVRHLGVVPKDNRPESELVAELRHAMATEIRSHSLLSEPRPLLPPPANLDAEQELMCLLLAGYKTPGDFKPLRAEHLFARLYQLIWEAAEAVCDQGEVCELETIAREMQRRGFVGELARELEAIFYTPAIGDTHVQRRIAQVIEAAKQRKLIEVMHRCDLLLRTGEIDVDGARARLREFFQKVNE